jgi:hypothetical protein
VSLTTPSRASSEYVLRFKGHKECVPVETVLATLYQSVLELECLDRLIDIGFESSTVWDKTEST